MLSRNLKRAITLLAMALAARATSPTLAEARTTCLLCADTCSLPGEEANCFFGCGAPRGFCGWSQYLCGWDKVTIFCGANGEQ